VALVWETSAGRAENPVLTVAHSLGKHSFCFGFLPIDSRLRSRVKSPADLKCPFQRFVRILEKIKLPQINFTGAPEVGEKSCNSTLRESLRA